MVLLVAADTTSFGSLRADDKLHSNAAAKSWIELGFKFWRCSLDPF
jgi:hypothetical protein